VCAWISSSTSDKSKICRRRLCAGLSLSKCALLSESLPSSESSESDSRNFDRRFNRESAFTFKFADSTCRTSADTPAAGICVDVPERLLPCFSFCFSLGFSLGVSPATSVTVESGAEAVRFLRELPYVACA
jgi:hypothetical protein